jgi:hypothetical protein
VSIRLLAVLAATELFSLLVLLINLATVHVPVVATILGPLHGCVYLATIIGATMAAGPKSLPTLLSIIPGIGGTLAVVDLKRRGRPANDDAMRRATR